MSIRLTGPERRLLYAMVVVEALVIAAFVWRMLAQR